MIEFLVKVVMSDSLRKDLGYDFNFGVYTI